MLINLSNHPAATWAPEQMEAARKGYGEVIDLPFPAVPPTATEDDVLSLAAEYIRRAMEILPDPYAHVIGCPQADGGPSTAGCTCPRDAIHLMGETSFVIAFYCLAAETRYLQDGGVPCVCSTTERVVVDNPDGTKTSTFRFIQFRDM